MFQRELREHLPRTQAPGFANDANARIVCKFAAAFGQNKEGYSCHSSIRDIRDEKYVR